MVPPQYFLLKIIYLFSKNPSAFWYGITT